jgi:hypothetical protein
MFPGKSSRSVKDMYKIYINLPNEGHVSILNVWFSASDYGAVPDHKAERPISMLQDIL